AVVSGVQRQHLAELGRRGIRVVAGVEGVEPGFHQRVLARATYDRDGRRRRLDPVRPSDQTHHDNHEEDRGPAKAPVRCRLLGARNVFHGEGGYRSGALIVKSWHKSRRDPAAAHVGRLTTLLREFRVERWWALARSARPCRAVLSHGSRADRVTCFESLPSVDRTARTPRRVMLDAA